MFISIITLFPNVFPGTTGISVLGKALKNNIWSLNVVDLSKFTTNTRCDDKPYGGGPGMVIRPDVMGRAIDYTKKQHNENTKIIYTTPRGKLFSRDVAKDLSIEKDLIFICGRFEGIDQRLIERYNMLELSLGNYIISGGEVATMVIIESTLRFVDNIVKNKLSITDDSFEKEGIIEYPLYTRPQKWCGMEVPSALFSGDHAKIKKWKEILSLKKDSKNSVI